MTKLSSLHGSRAKALASWEEPFRGGGGSEEEGEADRRLWRKKGGASPLNLWQVQAKFIFAKHAPKAKRGGRDFGTLPLVPSSEKPFKKEI